MRAIHIPRRFVLDSWGGTETVVAESCRRLSAHDVACEVFCPAALSQPGADTILDIPVQRFAYFYPYLGLGADAKAALDLKGGNLFSVSMFRQLMREPALDLIHLHTAKRLGGIGRTVARKRKIPYVITVHGGMIDVPPEEAATWTAPTAGTIEWGKVLGMLVGSRRVLSDADAIICVDPNEVPKMQARYPGKRVEFLANGVDPAPYQTGDGERFRHDYNIGPQQKILLNISRIDPQKNQRLAVEVLDRVRSSGEDVKLVLIGPVTNTDYHTQLQADIRAKGLCDQVLLIPGLPPGAQSLYDAYAAANAFLLSSVHEPFGIVILEAWAAGTPVVAASVGGVPAFTHHGEDILRFESHDAAAATEHVLAVLRTDGLADALATQASRLVQQKFHWDTITEQLATLYRDIAENRRRRS